MPKISLVVCLRGERDFLARLLEHAEGCYDDLVVVHDGRETGEADWAPSPPRMELAIDWARVPSAAPLPEIFARNQTQLVRGSLREFVESRGGRFFEHPRIGSLEGQSPFAWWAAKHDWILRFDADEYPTVSLSGWIADFRIKEESSVSSLGFSCIWPLWDGHRTTTTTWPTGRLFLFDRRHASMIGMPEVTPTIEGGVSELPLILCHQPHRKSYGIRNILFRRQAYVWRKVIATSLLKSPLSIPRWRYATSSWPGSWHSMVEEPLLEGFYRLFKFPLEQARSLRIHKERLSLSICLNPALHHFMICMQLWKLRGFPRPRTPLRRVVKKLLLGSTFAMISSKINGLQTLGGICPWTLDLSLIHNASKVVSGGVGGDVSFELELARQTGCEIALFDPSPTGRATIASLETLPRGLKFHETALAGGKGKRKFAAPLDADEGSFREPDSADHAGFEWPSVSVEDFVRENGWGELDLLKLDIEGFEFEVMDALLRSKLRPRQLLVEFHYGQAMKHSFWNYMCMLLRLRAVGYVLVHREKSDHSFVRHPSKPRNLKGRYIY